MVTFNYLPGKSLPGTCAHRDQQIAEHSFFQFQNSCLVITLFVHNQQGRNTVSKDNITTAPGALPQSCVPLYCYRCCCCYLYYYYYYYYYYYNCVNNKMLEYDWFLTALIYGLIGCFRSKLSDLTCPITNKNLRSFVMTHFLKHRNISAKISLRLGHNNNNNNNKNNSNNNKGNNMEKAQIISLTAFQNKQEPAIHVE